MSVNKENVKAIERRKPAMKGNKEDSSERNPLKTLSFHTNAENSLAGPSQSSSKPLDTRYVTYRNHCEDLDWGFLVFKDDKTKPVDKTDNKEKFKTSDKKIENEKSKKNERRAENEQSKKEKRIERDQSNKERRSEKDQLDREKRAERDQSNKEKRIERDQSNKEKKTEKDQPNKEKRIEKDQLIKVERIEHDPKNKERIESEYPKNNKNDLLAPVISVVLKNTPLVVINTPNVEIYPTKKVKRSLKRPHARLQATTSPVSSKSCQFTIYSNNDIRIPLPSSGEVFDPLNEAYTIDNLNYLLKLEKKVMGEPRIRNASRSCVINWIINVNGSTGNPAVVQLASWYFDCYLSSAWVSVDKLQVIAAACFWIATKFHGRIISGRRLVKYSGHAFIENELVAAERHILRKLKFQAVPVAPHDFVPYLSWCCDESKSGVVEAAAVFLCQCGVMTDKTLSEEYPSVVAAAAVKNALLLLRLSNSMHKLTACHIYKAAEKKASDLDATCSQLRDAVRVVASVGYEYKAPLFKFSGPPHYISNNIVTAVNHKDIVLLDVREKRVKRSI